MPTQRYRITADGFRCNAPTWDDAGQWDGKGDEVFISTSGKYVDKAGSILSDSSPLASRTMGDTNNQPNRIQAGSLSPQGGIRAGDSFPSSQPWQRSGTLSTAAEQPPMLLWEGDLICFITVAHHIVSWLSD